MKKCIKVNELRIGNWVNIISAEEWIGQVTEIGRTIGLDYTYYIKNDKTYDYIKHCYPIPITEEWLEGFGFKENKVIVSPTWIMYNNGYYSVILDNEGIIVFNINSFQIKIKYVHQLQNLYFALTGEELVLKNN